MLWNLEGHRGDILELRFLRGGRLVISGARDNTIKIWDVARGVLQRDVLAVNSHRGDVTTLVPIMDGRRMLTSSSDGSCKVWDLAADQLADIDEKKVETDVLGMLKKEVAAIVDGDDDDDNPLAAIKKSSAVSPATAHRPGLGPDESKVPDTMVPPGPAAHLHASKDRVLATQLLHESVHAIAVNSRLPLLLSSSSTGPELRLWDVSNLGSFRMIQQFVGHRGEVVDVCATDDESTVFSSSLDWTCLQYGVAGLTLLNVIKYTSSILAMARSKDNKTLVLAGTDYTPKVYDMTSRTPHDPILSLTGHAGRVRSVAISNDDQYLVTGSQDFNLCLYDLAKARATVAGNVANFNGNGPSHISGSTALLVDDSIATSSSNGPKKVDYIERTQPGCGHILSLAFCPDDSISNSKSGHLLAVGSGDHSVRVYKVKSGSLKEMWCSEMEHTSVVTSVVFGRGASAGLLFTGSWDKTIRVWRVGEKVTNPQLVSVLGGQKGHSNKISQLDITPDGRYLVSAAFDRSVILWNATAPFEPIARYTTLTNDGAFTSVAAMQRFIVVGAANGMVYEFPLFNPDQVHPSFNDVDALRSQLAKTKEVAKDKAGTDFSFGSLIAGSPNASSSSNTSPTIGNSTNASSSSSGSTGPARPTLGGTGSASVELASL